MATSPQSGMPARRAMAHLFLLILVATCATTVSWTLGLRDLVRRLDPHLDKLPTITIPAQ